MYIFKKILLIFLGILVSFLVTPGCNQGVNKKKVIRLAHSLNTQHPVHLALLDMARRVEEKSEGKLSIKIYPNGQLGNEKECVELLQIGSLGMTKVSAAVIEAFAEEYKVLGLPYLFRDKAHGETVLDGEIGRQFLLSTDDVWLRGLCFYDAGYRSFYTKDIPIRTPDDLKGLNIRVMKSITANDMIDVLGGNPTPIPFGELYTALQSGVVDGAENNPPSLYTSRHYLECKYYSLDEHTMIPDVLLISTHIWNDLSVEEQQWVQEAANESVEVQRIEWMKFEEESMRVIREAKVQIITPDKKAFVDKVQPIYEGYKKYPKLYNLINAIQNTKSQPQDEEN